MSLRRFVQSSRPRRERRSFAIRGWVGPNGHGKTTGAVFDLMPSLDAGLPVLSTARLLDYTDPRPCDDPACTWPGHDLGHLAAHPLWIPFHDWRQLMEFPHGYGFSAGEVFMDEVAGVASSRESGSLPFQVARELQKLRKRDTFLTYTAPSFARCEKIIREVTTLLTESRGHLAKVAQDGERERLWRSRSLFTWKSYDASKLEASMEKGDGKSPRPLVSQLFSLVGHDVTRCFDTYDQVLSLGWANDAGMCMECGGQRARPKCTCGLPARRAEGVVLGGRSSTAPPEGQAARTAPGPSLMLVDPVDHRVTDLGGS